MRFAGKRVAGRTRHRSAAASGSAARRDGESSAASAAEAETLLGPRGLAMAACRRAAPARRAGQTAPAWLVGGGAPQRSSTGRGGRDFGSSLGQTMTWRRQPAAFAVSATQLRDAKGVCDAGAGALLGAALFLGKMKCGAC